MNNKCIRNYNLIKGLVILLLGCSTFVPLYAQTNQDSQPALYQAMAKNDLAMAKAAINSGDDVNAIYDRDTMLCWALRKERPEIAKLIMLSPKIDVNRRGFWYNDFDDWERPPLILAAQMGQSEMVDLLLKKGAEINARDRVNDLPLSRGDTALLKAARRDHLETVRVLFTYAKKPDINIQDKDGKTAFWHAVANEDLEMVKLLYNNGSRINLPDNTGSSVLTTTVLHKNYNILDFLVAKGADINLVNNYGDTPLISAILSNNKNHKEVVLKYLEKFLTFKPKLDYQQIRNNNGGDSALHLAARFGFIEAIKLLLDQGANINIISLATGGTPLHTAAASQNIAAAKYLIQRGAKLEIKDPGGATPLLTAVTQADLPMVQVLVESGAVINTRSANVLDTPLNVPAANINPLKHQDFLAIMSYLLEKQADINFQSANGKTALMTAAASGDHGQAFEKGALLINKGAKLDLVNDRGETALMLAAGTGNEKFVKLLLEKGAAINLKNGAGESAMSYANRSGKKAVITLLESKGAKPDAPIVAKKVIIDALIGTWKGYQDGMPQAVFNIVFNKDSTFVFNSQLTPEVLKQYPPGSMNPIIAAQKGTYTFNNDIMIWNPVGAAPVSMKWKLENNMLIIDNKIRLKKIK